MARPIGSKHTDEGRANISAGMKAYWAKKKGVPLALSEQHKQSLRDNAWDEVKRWFGVKK